MAVRPDDTEPCPFDLRLARTPYLVIPKLALQAMPMAWRKRLDALLAEADRAGLVTPDYLVFRNDGPGAEFTQARVVNRETGFARLTRGKPDPWANYRRASLETVKALSPGFDPAPKLCPFNDEGAPDLPDDFDAGTPCPVCGDLGTFTHENMDRPSRCISPAADPARPLTTAQQED